MFFKDVIGYEKLKANFTQMVENGRVPHAILLSGPQGVGKLSMALALAQVLLCESFAEGDSCGRCRSCLQAANLTHPDLHLVFPIIANKDAHIAVCDDLVSVFRRTVLENPFITIDEWFAIISQVISGENAKSKRGMIYNAEGDEIIRKISMKPYQGINKVMIIWLPEMMNQNCANHVLKILEEPPANTTFILVSDHPEQLLLTIRSRCQNFEMPAFDRDEIIGHLKSNFVGLTDEQIGYLAHTSRGIWGEALSLISRTAELDENFELFKLVMRTALNIDPVKIKGIAESFAKKDRNAQLSFLRYAQRMVRDNFMYYIGNSDLSYLNSAESQFALKFSTWVTERNVLKFSEQLALAEEHIAQNVNSEIVMFHTICKLYSCLHNH